MVGMEGHVSKTSKVDFVKSDSIADKNGRVAEEEIVDINFIY
jgi:hypothetical protein